MMFKIHFILNDNQRKCFLLKKKLKTLLINFSAFMTNSVAHTFGQTPYDKNIYARYDISQI